MTDATTRRAVVTGLAIAGSELAPFQRPARAAVASDMPGPIELGYARYEALAKAHDDACEASWKAEDLYDEPARPGWHPFHDEGGHKVIPTRPGKGRVYADERAENIAYLRQIIEAPEKVLRTRAGSRTCSCQGSRKRARP